MTASPPSTRPSGWQRAKRTREQAERAMELYANGMPVGEIAREMGITQNRVGALIGQGLAEAPEHDIEEMRGAVDLRLDRAARVAGELLDHEDPRIRISAVTNLRQIERDRMALRGLATKPRDDDLT